MSSHDLAADLSSGLEVKQPSGANADAGASPASGPGTGADPGGAGNPPSGTSEGKALNRASEALKRTTKMEAELSELRRTNQSLIQMIASKGTAPTPPPVESKRPYDQNSLTQMLENGETQKFVEATEANAEWQRNQDRLADREEFTKTLDTRDEATRINSYLMRELGFASGDSDSLQKIDEEARELRTQFPSMDPATAQVVAAGKVYRSAATGTLELEDLRTEHLRNTSDPDPEKPRATMPVQKIDWDAPNRGLPPAIVERFHTFKLSAALNKGNSPQQEANFRRVIEDIVQQEARVARKRSIGGYV